MISKRIDQFKIILLSSLIIIGVYLVKERKFNKQEQNSFGSNFAELKTSIPQKKMELELSSQRYFVTETTHDVQISTQLLPNYTTKFETEAFKFFKSNFLASPFTNNSEWADINQKIFFKKNTAVYFHDQKYFAIMFVINHNVFEAVKQHLKFNLKFTVSQGDDKATNNMEVKHVNLISFHNHINAVDVLLKANLDLNLNNQTNISKVKHLKVSISLILNENENYMTKTMENILVKIVDKTFYQSDDMYICLEPSFMEIDEFVNLKWFIEMSYLMGYNKIVFNNNSIPNSVQFKGLFEKYSKILQINPFNYLPNLVKPELNKIYAEHMEELTKTGEEYSGPGILYHYLNDFGINECLLTNKEKAKLIFFPDTDETFIPTKLKNFDYPEQTYKFLSSNTTDLHSQEKVILFEKSYLSNNNCMKEKQGESLIKNYLDNVYQKYQIHNDSSLFFPQVFFLTDNLMKEIFYRLEETFNDANISRNDTIRVKIFQKHKQTESRGFKFHSAEWDTDFTLLIQNENEINYAKNLLSLYKHLIEPYLKENEKKLKAESERLSRYFYLDLRNDIETISYVGKSFVNPVTSELMFNPHVPNHHPGFLYGRDKSNVFAMPPNHHKDISSYYIAHFRDRYKMGKADKSITRIQIDLNYFTCYVKPIIENTRSQN